MTNYNIGAGSFRHPDWINVDMASEWYSSVQAPGFIEHDLTTLADLPIESGSADLVYCSHVVEHIPADACQKLLSECFRILKPGGGLRLVAPDHELAYRNWKRGDRDFFEPSIIHTGHDYRPTDATCTQLFLNRFVSQLSQIDADPTAAIKFADAFVEAVFRDKPFVEASDYFVAFAKFNHERPENHVTWFTHEKLIANVEAAGFPTVYRSGVGQSLFPAMRNVKMFDPHYAISLYVEAIK